MFTLPFTDLVITDQAVIVFLFALGGLYGLRFVVTNYLKGLSERTDTDFDDFFVHLVGIWNWPVLVVISFYAATQFLQLLSATENLLSAGVTILIGWYLGLTGQKIIDYFASKYVLSQQGEEDSYDPTLINFMKIIVKSVVWMLLVLLVLQNLGFQIGALIGGLGIGGIAVAFAIQNVLGDVFSSISLYFDKPFKVGEFIVVGQQAGVVEKIGLRSTRIRTLQGELLVMSNQQLTTAEVQNFKHLRKRRIVSTIGVEYSTPVKKLRQIPEWIKEIVEQQDNVEFNRAHLATFGDFSLNYELVYHVTVPDYDQYMDIQQAINFSLIEKFEQQKVVFAFPTQTIELKKT